MVVGTPSLSYQVPGTWYQGTDYYDRSLRSCKESTTIEFSKLCETHCVETWYSFYTIGK